MARGGINKALVRMASEALLARGLHPSIDAVRVEMGNTGSKTTIQRYLKELSHAGALAAQPSLNEELQSLISSLAARLLENAQTELADEWERFQRQQATAAQQREIERVRLEQLQDAHAMLSQDRRDGLAREHGLQERLQAAEGECQRLGEAHHQQERLLAERTTQIASLEDKHRHARDALAHYREQHLVQRNQEAQRQDAQVQHLQRELRTVQEHLLSKQEELGQLYRDLERMSSEQHQHQQELRHLEQALQTSKHQAETAHTERQGKQQENQRMVLELGAQREKTKRHLHRLRQAQRDQRKMSQQLVQLQALLQHLTYKPPD
ncbi:DNA-binding protein [Pseudomonas viridiflava]|uniref:DNA-binding protein n=1 Tax=Pseudomonas viridiflava TaxID=33069 RepID=UPI000F0686C1|nr:DNA-binding protein [Pseudomonas viridiflava]